MSEPEIIAYNIPTACPLVFEFDQDMNPLKNYYLLNAEELAARQKAVAEQAKRRWTISSYEISTTNLTFFFPDQHRIFMLIFITKTLY